MIRIIKIGGKLIENDAVLNGLCDELSACYRDSVLVHGGGSMAGQLSARLGIRTRMIDGRRITDRETLEVAVMAYAGWANKKLVAALQVRNVNACGLSGCDQKVILAHKREVKEIDWGFVGDIVMPVISPITYDGAGQLLNTNADSVAGAVAVALSRIDDTELIFCFDKPGVLLDVNDADSVIPVLDKEKYAGYLEQGAIHAGMIPKLDNAFKTIKAGVKSVRLTDPCHLDGGTVLR